jgi:hypothetical protein
LAQALGPPFSARSIRPRYSLAALWVLCHFSEWFAVFSADRSQNSRWPAAQNLYIPPPPAAGLYILLCIFLAVGGL